MSELKILEYIAALTPIVVPLITARFVKNDAWPMIKFGFSAAVSIAAALVWLAARPQAFNMADFPVAAMAAIGLMATAYRAIDSAFKTASVESKGLNDLEVFKPTEGIG